MKKKQIIAFIRYPIHFSAIDLRNILTSKLPITRIFSFTHSHFNQRQMTDELMAAPSTAYSVTLIIKEARTLPIKLFSLLTETIHLRKNGKKNHLFSPNPATVWEACTWENNRVKTMIIKFFNTVFYAKNIMTLFFAFFLFGCEMSSELKSPKPNTSSSVSAQSVALTPAAVEPQPAVREARTEKYDAEGDKLQMCQSQLEALRLMSPMKYAQMRKSFDYLMKGAAQYSDIRQKANADTQETVDALYRYRANLLCAQIAQTLLDGLTRRGEARP